MIYRKLDDNGDMVFGRGERDYLKNTPECVAQSVATRLKLWRGEWFLDETEGTPYAPSILGKHTSQSYDMAIRERVLDTPGVSEIVEYASSFNGETRKLAVNMTINTVYGEVTLQEIM